MALSRKTREYLRRIAECDSSITPWRQWCTDNMNELEANLSRTGYLKLKFSPEEAVPKLLEQEAIPFHTNELKNFLADAGRGWQTPIPDGYGVHQLYARGEIARADAILEREAAAIAASDDPSRGLILSEMVLDAEHCQRHGFLDEARGLARAVSQLPKGDDMIDPAIDGAQSFLRTLR